MFKYITVGLLSITPLVSLFGGVNTEELTKLENDKTEITISYDSANKELNEYINLNDNLEVNLKGINESIKKEKDRNKVLKEQIKLEKVRIEKEKFEAEQIRKEKLEQERIEKEQERLKKEEADRLKKEEEQKQKDLEQEENNQSETTKQPEAQSSPQTSVTTNWSGQVLTKQIGRMPGPNGVETYYNLPMQGVIDIARSQGIQGEYWVREDGVKMYGEYIMVASGLNIRPRGSLIGTSLGMGIVLDTGSFAYSDPTQIDIATTWE